MLNPEAVRSLKFLMKFTIMKWGKWANSAGAEQASACCPTGPTVGERYRLMARAALGSQKTTSCLQAGNAQFTCSSTIYGRLFTVMQNKYEHEI